MSLYIPNVMNTVNLYIVDNLLCIKISRYSTCNTSGSLPIVLHQYAYFHIYRYRLFSHSNNRYADIWRYSKQGKEEQKILCAKCICSYNVINCQLCNVCCTTNFHGKKANCAKPVSQTMFLVDSEPC